MSEYAKPLPVPDVDTRPYWEAAKRHELRIQRCVDCGTYRHYPRTICPECRSRNTEWALMSGKGQIYSFIVVHHLIQPSFRGDLPYAVALVALDEQHNIRLPSNIVGCKPEDIRVGMPVEVVFDDVTPEVTLPKWQPAAS